MSTTVEEIQKLIETLKAKISSGPDGIIAQLLKLLTSTIWPALQIVFNKVLEAGKFPEIFKEATTA